MKNHILIQHWLKRKPYKKWSRVDLEYLEISNRVYIGLKKQSYITNMIQFEGESVVNLAIFLTAYLEDLVSETNIWNTFLKINTDLFGKKLPFYSQKKHISGEVNQIDIEFLIWYFVNLDNRERFLNPYDAYFGILAKEVFEILNHEFDYVSENTNLKNSYILANNADYYETRRVIQKYLFESYLFAPDACQELDNELAQIRDGIKDPFDLNNIDYLNQKMHMSTDTFTHQFRTKLLAFKGKDWVKEIIGKEHPLYNSLNNLSAKIGGYFFFIRETESHNIFEHIASGKLFNINKESYFIPINTMNDTIHHIEIIRWNNEWLLSGVAWHIPFDADLILDEKNSQESRSIVSNIDYESLKENLQTIKEHEKIFKKTFGSSVVFTTTNKTQKVIQTFVESFNKTNGEGEHNSEKKDALKRMREQGYFNNKEPESKFSKEEDMLVFFNPNSGLEIYANISCVFPEKTNLSYVNENTLEIKMLLFSPIYSKELTEYFIEKYAKKLNYFTNDMGKKYLKDIDFLLRFWKNDNYYNMPNITII